MGSLGLGEVDLTAGLAPLIVDARRAAVHQIRGRARTAQGPLADEGLAFAHAECRWYGSTRTTADAAFVAWLPEGIYHVQGMAGTGTLTVRGPMAAVELVLTP